MEDQRLPWPRLIPLGHLCGKWRVKQSSDGFNNTNVLLGPFSTPYKVKAQKERKTQEQWIVGVLLQIFLCFCPVADGYTVRESCIEVDCSWCSWTWKLKSAQAHAELASGHEERLSVWTVRDTRINIGLGIHVEIHIDQALYRPVSSLMQNLFCVFLPNPWWGVHKNHITSN